MERVADDRSPTALDAHERAEAAPLGAVVVCGPDGSYSPRDLAWPWWLPWGSLMGAVFIGAESIRHRAGQWGADSLVVAAPLIVLAALPFLVDTVAHRYQRLVIHRLPWAAVVLAPTIAVAIHSPTENDFAAFFVVLMAIQVGATASKTAVSVTAVGVACGALIGLELAGEVDGTAIWVVGTLAGFAGGLAVRKSVEALTHERAMRATRMEKAATDERQRIAREIHDVIAHSLSVTMLHLTGARRALETDRDVDEAAEALREAEHLGRQAMSDIRRTVGLLDTGNGSARAPTPGVADVGALVEGFRAAGLAVDARVEGDASAVSASTGLGLYRIAQESLTNVARHAPGADVALQITVTNGTVTITVANGPARSTTPIDLGNGGLGVEGMRERATLLGGALSAGPNHDGWLVSATLPLAAAAGEGE